MATQALKPWLSCESSPQRNAILLSAPVDKWVRCVWSPSVFCTLIQQSFSSVLVCLHSDGRDGEWLVWWFYFQFLMVDKVTFSLFQYQSNLKYHGHCFSSKLKDQACTGHKCICCLDSSGTHIRKRPATKAGSCTLLSPRLWDFSMPWRAIARCFCTAPAWSGGD